MADAISKELQFARLLEQVKQTARNQGNMISKEQVEEAFRELALEEAQLALVFDYLEKNKIGIGEPADLDSYLTDEEHDYLEEYMQILAALPELSDGEKEAVTLSAMAGDPDAQSRLLEAFLPEVPEIAKLYAGQGVYLEDLIGQGNMALSEGVSMLGCEENAQGAQSMLVRMIMDAMEELIESDLEAQQSDKEIEERVNEIADKARELAEDLRRKVTVQELSQETGISEEDIRECLIMTGYSIEDIEEERP